MTKGNDGFASTNQKQSSKRNSKNKHKQMRHNNNKKRSKTNNHRGNNQSSSQFRRPRHEKLEIKFDPEARRTYLTSLSSKKKERRTYGLAMQKVKDRKLKLEEKRETKKALLEQIEESS